jgi:hypothetical protein
MSIQNVIDALKSYGYEIKEDRNKTPHIIISSDIIPFINISKSYKSVSKINILKMIQHMRDRNIINTTYGSKSYGLIDLYAGLGKVIIAPLYNLIENDVIFSHKDKFIYKIVKLLNSIFIGIDKNIITNDMVYMINGYMIDLNIKLSDGYQIFIEYEGSGSVTANRYKIANSVASYLIYKPTDNFDNFFKAVCFTIIKFKNIIQKNDNINWISRIISYGIFIRHNVKTDYVNVREIIQIFKKKTIHIKNLSELLNDDMSNVIKFIMAMIENKMIDNKNITYEKGDIFSINQPEINKIILSYDNSKTNQYRTIYQYIVDEYLDMLNGEYDTYQYRSPDFEFISTIEDEILEKQKNCGYGSDF